MSKKQSSRKATGPTNVLVIRPGSVSQLDLENIVTLDAQIENLQRNRDTIAIMALQRILDGFDVEAGRRNYYLDESYVGGKKETTLVVR